MTKKKKDTKECSKCKEDKELSEYYLAASDMIHADGRIGICKQCLWNIVDFENTSSLIRIMREINRPYLHDMYLSALNSNRKNKTGEYMRLLGMKQNRELDFSDSDFGEDDDKLKRAEERVIGNSVFTEEEMEQLIELWGRGYSPEEYKYLQDEYETLLNSYEADSHAMRILFQEAAQQRLTIKRNREKGNAVDKDLKTLQDLLGSANVKPVQETGANATEQATFGTLIKKFENERPIPEPDPEWKDVNGIRKYIDVWFKGHLMRMLGHENDTVELYDKEVGKYTVTPPTYDEDDEN